MKLIFLENKSELWIGLSIKGTVQPKESFLVCRNTVQQTKCRCKWLKFIFSSINYLYCNIWCVGLYFRHNKKYLQPKVTVEHASY